MTKLTYIPSELDLVVGGDFRLGSLTAGDCVAEDDVMKAAGSIS